MVENKKFFFRFLQPIFICSAYLFLYLPIIVLAVFSFNDSVIPAKWVGFSLRWYTALLKNPEIIEAFQVSIIVAIVSTILSVLLGTCFVVASKWWQRMFLFNIFYTNILLPEIIANIPRIYPVNKLPPSPKKIFAG